MSDIISTNKIDSLVQLYEARPVLWDLQHKDYNDRDKRQQALNEISESLAIEGKFYI